MERIAGLDRDICELRHRIEEGRCELIALESGAIDIDDLRASLKELDPIWGELFPRERARVLSLLLERVEFHGAMGEVVLAFRPGVPRGVVGEVRP